MTKPWEETWSALLSGPACDFRSAVVGEDGEPVLYAAERGATVRAAHPSVQLAACAPEMARMLLAVPQSEAQCLWCGAFDDETVGEYPKIVHLADCAWLALMRRAGVRE